jgi:hypothetical protein
MPLLEHKIMQKGVFYFNRQQVIGEGDVQLKQPEDILDLFKERGIKLLD